MDLPFREPIGAPLSGSSVDAIPRGNQGVSDCSSHASHHPADQRFARASTVAGLAHGKPWIETEEHGIHFLATSAIEHIHAAKFRACLAVEWLFKVGQHGHHN